MKFQSNSPKKYRNYVSVSLLLGLLLLSFPFSEWHTIRGLAYLNSGLDIRFLMSVALLLIVGVVLLISRSPDGRRMLGKKYYESLHQHDVFTNSHTRAIFLSISIISLATLMNGVLQMGLPFYEMFYRPIFYFGLLICPIIILASDKDYIKTVHITIITITFFWLSLHILAKLSPSFFLQIIEPSLRNDTTRLGLNRFVFPVGVRLCIMYTYIYGLQKTIDNPIKNWGWFLMCLLILGDMLFVSMLRRYVISMVILGLTYLLLFTSLIKKHSSILSLIIIISTIFSLLPGALHEHINKLIDMVLDIQDTGGDLRLACFKHYWNEFKLTHYLGLGDYPNNRVRYALSVNIHNRFGFFIGDLGLFSGLLKYGFQAMLITAWIYYFFLKTTWRAIYSSGELFLGTIAKTLFLMVIWQIFSLEIFIWDFHYSYYWGLLFYMYYAIDRLSLEKQ